MPSWFRSSVYSNLTEQAFIKIDHKARQAKLVAYSGFDENFIAQVSEVCIDHYPYHKVLLDGEVVITDDYENYTEKLARQIFNSIVCISADLC